MRKVGGWGRKLSTSKEKIVWIGGGAGWERYVKAVLIRPAVRWCLGGTRMRRQERGKTRLKAGQIVIGRVGRTAIERDIGA